MPNRSRFSFALAGNAPSPREDFFYWNEGGTLVALRFNQWKMVFQQHREHGLAMWGKPFGSLHMPKLCNVGDIADECTRRCFRMPHRVPRLPGHSQNSGKVSAAACNAAMLALETNVLVRLLARDDARQALAADRSLVKGGWISLLVLAQASWVLDAV